MKVPSYMGGYFFWTMFYRERSMFRFGKKAEVLTDEDKAMLQEVREKRRLEQERVEREERIRKVLTTDPWDFDLIKKIAKETDMNFELINQTTGQILRFYKKDDRVEVANLLEEQAIAEGRW
jgi:hypothetical protein